MALSRPVSMDRKYRTEDGKPVRIYCTDGSGLYPAHGAILGSDGIWSQESWTVFGVYRDGCKSMCDLVEVVEPAFDTSKQWMRRSDGRRPDKIDLLDDGYVRYWIGNDFFVVDPKGFRAIPSHPSPNDLIPYVPKVREWNRADVPWPRPEFQQRTNGAAFVLVWMNSEGVCISNNGFVDWSMLKRDWLHSTDGGRTWKACEVSE